MYRNLDPAKIMDTADRLRKRIEERFPGSGLSQVAVELLTLAREASDRARLIRKPNRTVRVTSGLLVLGMLGSLLYLILNLDVRGAPSAYEFVQVLGAGAEALFFLGAAVVFLVTLETRLKRTRALNAVHELRSVAHIIDMHQLTKDPETTLKGGDTASSPARRITPYEMSRYLDYCSEMLSLLSKLAALYVQKFPDSGALEAVDQIEDLTTGLSRKIWQKLDIVNRLVAATPSAARAEAAEEDS